MNNGENNTNQVNTNVQNTPGVTPIVPANNVNQAPQAPSATTDTNSNSGDPNGLMPMAGVKVAPISAQPIDASKNTSSTAPAFTNKPDNTTSAPTVPTSPTPPVVTPTQNSTTSSEVSREEAATKIEDPVAETAVSKKKGGGTFTLLLLLIIIGLGGYIYFITQENNKKLANMRYNCTPITSSKEEKKLDLNSTLVKDLYSKVYTNIREDLAQPQFNDNMKLYLAYRQISEADKYASNCNLFSLTEMEPYKCDDENGFTPKAFKAETLQLEYKKLFGEQTNPPQGHIRLGLACIGGYQYIPERGEYVEGYCTQQTTTLFRVTKKLKKATSNRNTIVLTEEVKYHESEQLELPDSLQSGTYDYIFRLDMNYNFVLVDKVFENND